jgi:hypothetical protein
VKPRRHHNNYGARQIHNGGTTRSLQRIARKLRIPFSTPATTPAHAAHPTGDKTNNGESHVIGPESLCSTCGLPSPSDDHREICGVNHSNSTEQP